MAVNSRSRSIASTHAVRAKANICVDVPQHQYIYADTNNKQRQTSIIMTMMIKIQ